MTDRLDAFVVTLPEFVRWNSGRLTISAARTTVMPGTHCLNLQWVNRRIVRPSGIPSAIGSAACVALVSSSFPACRTLDGSRLLSAVSLWPCPCRAGVL